METNEFTKISSKWMNTFLRDLANDKDKIMSAINISESEIENLYQKAGLTDTTRDRDVQLATFSVLNRIIKQKDLINAYNKYNFIECKEMLDTIKN